MRQVEFNGGDFARCAFGRSVISRIEERTREEFLLDFRTKSCSFPAF
jgi:hypothetical protein